MNRDTFTSTNKIPVNHNNIFEDDDNFFLQSDNITMRGIVQPETSRHLNDYDSNILKEDAYRDVKDELFKLEYKISRTEEEIKSIEQQIQSANAISDILTIQNLQSRKSQLTEDLCTLTDMYKEAGLSSKISGGFASKFKDTLSYLKKNCINLYEIFVSKLPGKFSSFAIIRSSLGTLENINKSVDVLMNCQYPYGESADKYEQLSKYIAKANSIQSEIYKFMK